MSIGSGEALILAILRANCAFNSNALVRFVFGITIRCEHIELSNTLLKNSEGDGPGSLVFAVMKNLALTAYYLAGCSSFISLMDDVAQIGDIELFCDFRMATFPSCVLEMKFLVPSAVSGFERFTDLLPPSVFMPADMNEVFLLAPLD